MGMYQDGVETKALTRKRPALNALTSMKASVPDAYALVWEHLKANAPKDLVAFLSASDTSVFPARLYIEFLSQAFTRLGEAKFETAWTRAAMSYFDWEVAKSVWGVLGARFKGRPADALAAAAGTWRQTMPGCGEMTVTPDGQKKVAVTLVGIPSELCDDGGQPKPGFCQSHRGIATRVVEMAGAKGVERDLELRQGQFRYTLQWH